MITECSIEVDNKGHKYLKYRNCLGKPKYIVHYSMKTGVIVGKRVLCERHLKYFQKHFDIKKIESLDEANSIQDRNG